MAAAQQQRQHDTCRLPRDVLLLIRDAIPRSAAGLRTHVDLCAASELFHEQIYSSPAWWKTLVQRAGYSHARRQFPSGAPLPPAPSPTNLQADGDPSDPPPLSDLDEEGIDWRTLAACIAGGAEGEEEAVQVVDVDAGSEGVEAKLYYGAASSCARNWLDQRDWPSPVGDDAVRRRSLRLEVNPYVKPFTDSADGLRRLHDRIAERCVAEGGGESADEGFNLLDRQPGIAHMFATWPPVTDLVLWLGPTKVHNPNGVTVWDVRLAILCAPRASSLVCFLDDRAPSLTAQGRTGSFTETGTSSVPEWLVAHDRLLAASTITSQPWQQEEPGSVHLGEQRGIVHYTGGNFAAFAF